LTPPDGASGEKGLVRAPSDVRFGRLPDVAATWRGVRFVYATTRSPDAYIKSGRSKNSFEPFPDIHNAR
jgi:hypothetical protein